MTNTPNLPSVEHIVATTQFTDPKRAAAARETLAWLEAGAPHHVAGIAGAISFEMARYIRKPGEDDCGTCCCIAGAIQQIEHGSVLNSRTPFDLDRDFDLDRNGDLRLLFYAGADDNAPHDWESPSDITASHAASVLRVYLTTGVVDWSLDQAEVTR